MGITPPSRSGRKAPPTVSNHHSSYDAFFDPCPLLDLALKPCLRPIACLVARPRRRHLQKPGAARGLLRSRRHSRGRRLLADVVQLQPRAGAADPALARLGELG